jgi:hypothetical protein
LNGLVTDIGILRREEIPDKPDRADQSQHPTRRRQRRNPIRPNGKYLSQKTVSLT